MGLLIPGRVLGAAMLNPVLAPSVHSLYAVSWPIWSASPALARPWHCKPDAVKSFEPRPPAVCKGNISHPRAPTPSSSITTRHRHSSTPLRPGACHHPLTPRIPYIAVPTCRPGTYTPSASVS
ncbi:hypothetical protein IQ06DRAFT_64504 [Phaeosphaeriaceae sp. SRC1lsM3a]|nr:hypothetical protein IQ06DRAFT_64504 [Stagonospora sp. SRC1lsM3a]